MAPGGGWHGYGPMARHSFKTGKWGAADAHDAEHWDKFAGFAEQDLHSKFREPDFVYDFASSDHIFMRWKEHFMVGDHRVESIRGASFAGFYYICYCRSTRSFEGLYYHTSSEKFQRLELSLVPDDKFGTFAFR